MYSIGRLGLAVVVLTGCALGPVDEDEATSESNGTEELNVGSVEAAETASWGSATNCKPIPALETLKSPEIVVSLDGLTLHLRDRAGTYDRVFPVGVGAIDGGKSKTPVGKFYTGATTAEVKDSGWGYYYPCRIWWTDPDTRKASPVFAGLPFIRLAGPPTAGYALHGPIDGFTAPTGGSLRRGYVSHGCVRMASADILEVYARIRGKSKVPVRIQQEVERDTASAAVDVGARWIGSECKVDTDCNYTGGKCSLGATGVGTCTLPCTRTCPDRAGEVPTFCASTGQCVPQASTTWNDACDRYAGRLKSKTTTRPDKSATATVCAS
ncbi:MAG: L,D-transpeptidase [Myxococcales bacterium]|nr:L,D-transpeptidase [Myxococcales bacterium]